MKKQELRRDSEEPTADYASLDQAERISTDSLLEFKNACAERAVHRVKEATAAASVQSCLSDGGTRRWVVSALRALVTTSSLMGTNIMKKRSSIPLYGVLVHFGAEGAYKPTNPIDEAHAMLVP